MTTEERLTRLERGLRRWQLGACLAAVAAVGMGMTRGQAELRGSSLTLVDEDGKARMLFSPESMSICFFDAKGKLRFGLGTYNDVPSILMVDDRGKQRMDLGL